MIFRKKYANSKSPKVPTWVINGFLKTCLLGDDEI